MLLGTSWNQWELAWVLNAGMEALHRADDNQTMFTSREQEGEDGEFQETIDKRAEIVRHDLTDLTC